MSRTPFICPINGVRFKQPLFFAIVFRIYQIYNKYKDISIELDYYGNISGWVGHINR